MPLLDRVSLCARAILHNIRGFGGAAAASILSTLRCRQHTAATAGVGLGIYHKIMSDKQIYKIVFINKGQVYEIYARRVAHGTLFGFIEVSELVFDERSSVVVDPSQEKLKSEFAGVKSTFLPLHSIVRIDEVEKQGTSKISKMEGGNVMQFPMPVYTPGSDNR